MPFLQVRDIPEELYEKLTQTAKAGKRTIAEETIFLLRKALNFQEQRSAERKHLLKEIKN
jgi:plasmid stability protein